MNLRVFYRQRDKKVLIIAAAFLMGWAYFLENKAQPEIFSSITSSIWWATVSLATVGYGDVVPVTVWGKIFASIISFQSLFLQRM